MRGPAASFLARRMLSSRLLLGSVLITILITAALTAALASFGAEGLPQAVHRQLARSAGVPILVSGSVNAPIAAVDARAVRSAMRRALRAVPFRLHEAVWSDPLGLPAPGGGKTVPLTEAASLDQIEAHATLTKGSWPAAPRAGGSVGAALPATVAQRLKLAPGARLTLLDRVTRHRVRVRVTGLFSLRDPASPYWDIDPVGTSGVSVSQQFVTYGPMVVSPAAFGRAGLVVGGASWAVLPNSADISESDVNPLAARINRAEGYLRDTASLGGLQVNTGLPALLTGLGENLVVARSLLSMGLLELLLLAAAALALAARLLASHREEESALLSSRGAARWQLVRPAILEALLLGVVAAGAGALIGGYVAGLLMNTGELRGTGFHSGIAPGAWLAALAVLLLSTVILLWPAVRPAAPGEARTRRGRQAALAGVARAGGDLALVALAVLAVVELRAYSAVAHGQGGGIGIDPVPVLAPTLALAGVTLVPLRLLPAMAKAADGLIAKTRRLGAALASWEISRRPIRQSGPVLLVILAVGMGSLALSQYQSWRRSAQDQAAFAVGADVRVQTLTPLALATAGAVAHVPGVTAAMPVTSTPGAASGEILGLDPRAAARTVELRSDLSPVPAAALWRKITPYGRPPGVLLPGRPARLRITAGLTGGGAGKLGVAAATLEVQDASGLVYTVPGGRMPSDGRGHALVATLAPARQANYPLRLLGISVSYTMPPYAGPQHLRRAHHSPASLVISGLAVAQAPSGPFGAPFAGGTALARWRPAVSSPGLDNIPLPVAFSGTAAGGAAAFVSGWQPAGGQAQSLVFSAGEAPSARAMAQTGVAESAITGLLTLSAAAPAKILPAIATESYLRATHVGVGVLVPVAVQGVSIPVKIVAAVGNFPTVGGGGALIVDQAALQGLLASRWDEPLQATEWWLRTVDGAVPAGLPPAASVADRVSLAAASVHNPLAAVPQQAALAIAAAAALLAAVGFAVSVAASLRARQTQSAVLAALGVGRPGQAGQLCLEQLMLSVPAAVAGLLAGAGLAHVLVPAVTLTSTGSRPVPPALVIYPLGWAVALAVVVAAIPVVVAAVSVARRPDPAAELRAAQAS
jgi:hypothetical protein